MALFKQRFSVTCSAASALLAAAVFSLSAAGASSSEREHSVELELGPVWQERNKVQIPNDASGDRFQLTDIAGSGPWASARVNALWTISGPHSLRLVLAPLSYSEKGALSEDVRFDGQTFTGRERLRAHYTFNSWRLGYRYSYLDSNGWQLWVGATAKVRDAEIKLEQGAVKAQDGDLGFVPLLHLAGEYRFDQRWSFQFDFDGLAGGPGRAIDLGLKLGYRHNDSWRLSAGYRGLEGGADVDDVYNFAWFNTALISLQYGY